MKEKVKNPEITSLNSKAQFSEVMSFHLKKMEGSEVDHKQITGLMTELVNDQK